MPARQYLRRLLLFIALPISFCCKNRNDGFIYHEKWVITDAQNMEPLRGHPAAVKETYYNDLSDTSFDSPPTDGYYIDYKFDRSGNNIFIGYHFSSTSVTEIDFKYGVNGIEHVMRSVDSQASKKSQYEIRSTAEKIGENKYKNTVYKDDKYERHVLITQTPDGRTETWEGWLKDISTGKRITYYNGDRIVREQDLKDSISQEQVRHYGESGFLDSVVTFKNGE